MKYVELVIVNRLSVESGLSHEKTVKNPKRSEVLVSNLIIQILSNFQLRRDSSSIVDNYNLNSEVMHTNKCQNILNS